MQVVLGHSSYLPETTERSYTNYMKIVAGLGVVVMASIALLQPAQGRPAGGGHSVAHGYHFSGSGRYYGGPRNYAGGSRYYAGGARYYSGGARYYRPYSQNGATQQRILFANRTKVSSVNRTTALNPRANSRTNPPRMTAAQTAALRKQGFDSHGRVTAQASRSWDHSHDHFWHGHQCHWNNNCWVAVDFWPWDYPWDWYGAGYGYGYDPYAYYDPGYYGDVYSPEPVTTMATMAIMAIMIPR